LGKQVCIIDGQGGGERVEIVGASREPLPHLVQAAVERIKEVVRHV
jgi:hypothetical protein